MNILVTGGCGYIGDCVVENLVDTGHNVTVVDNLTYTDSYMRPGVEFKRGCITKDWFPYFLARRKFHAIIHLAAVVGDGACQQNPDYTVNVNEVAVRTISRHAKEMGARLIFASTCSVYGNNSDILTEESPTNPLSLYAGTKLNAEKIIKDTLDNYVIFRLGTLFGVSTPFARIRADLIANILTFKGVENQPLTVFGGEQWRPLVHVRDVGKVFAEAVDEKFVGTYIVSTKNYKIIDVANEVKAITGAEVSVTDMKFEDLRNYKVDTAKADAAGAYANNISLYKGIVEMVNLVRSGRIKNPWISKYHNAKFMKEHFNV